MGQFFNKQRSYFTYYNASLKIREKRCICVSFVTEYFSRINVVGPALPSATFALSVRLPLASERAVSVRQWESPRFAS